MAQLKILEKDNLVPVYETENGEKVVFGTELHYTLEVKSKFADWIKNRLSDCDAVEKQDYDTFSKNLESGGRSVEYIIKLNTAKEMAMLERNHKGKEVRKYFIEIEKKYKNGIVDRSKLSPELQMMYMLADSQAKIEIEQKKQAEQIAKLEERQETIKEAVEPIKENWRQEIQKKINRIQKATGRQHNLLRTEIYSTLESRAGCDLETRLNNKRNRMRRDGNTVTAINKTNYIDVIAEDVRIKEIFEKIVTEYELKYC